MDKSAKSTRCDGYYITGVLNTIENSFNSIAQLKDSGLKVTGPCLKTLDLFEAHAEEHLSAEDVCRILLKQGIEIDIATTYRMLIQFEQAGTLQRHYFKTGKAAYELDKDGHHDHIACVKCGSIYEFRNPKIEALQDRIVEENGYRIVDHVLCVYDIYADCQTKAKCQVDYRFEIFRWSRSPFRLFGVILGRPVAKV